MEDLKHIIIEMKKICLEQGLKPSDDMVLDCSTRIFNSPRHQSDSYEPPVEKATSKQIWFLKKNGYEGDYENMTKAEASHFINEIKKERGI